MSVAMFPALAGQGWSVIKTPAFATQIQRSVSGREVRAARQTAPIWTFQLTYDLLRDDGTATGDLQTLAGFFLARQGSFDEFQFTDPTDCAAAGQQLGVGDGSTTIFPAVRTFGGFVEPVGAVTAVSGVTVGGTATTAYSLASVGGYAGHNAIQFQSAPAAGAAVAASFAFAFRCRFQDDQADFENFMNRLWSLKSLSFVSIIP